MKAALLDAGVDEEAVGDILKADPIVATNNSVAIFSNDDYGVVYFIGGEGEESNTKASVKILGNPESPTSLFNFNDDETKVAFCTANGLHFFDLKLRQTKKMETNNEKHLIGKLDWVYQEELYGRGNFKGYWWQSDGDQVAFLQLDETPLFPFTVMDHMPVRGKSEMTNYPKAGDPNPNVKVGVVASEGKSGINWVDLSKYEGQEILVTGVTWSADGEQLLLQIQNREQTWLDLVATHANGENPRVLFQDKTPAWIESPGDPVFLNDGEFLWRSPRSGYSHIYRYDSKGQMINDARQRDRLACLSRKS